jgi:hypothetical protein
MSKSTRRFTRQELYELVWSEPMVQLAKKFGLSDVGLSKACRRLAIPVPERGYWAKHQAGKPTSRQPLPPRGPGMHDEVEIGGENSWSYATAAEELVGQEIPPPPSFAEDITEVSGRVRKMVGNVAVPKTLTKPHPAIGRLLEEDERRREKRANSEVAWSWDRPLFDSALERHRLRILNAIFLAFARCGMNPSVRGREARDLGVQVGHTHVSFAIEPVTKPARSGRTNSTKGKTPRERLRFQIKTWPWAEDTRTSWEDNEEKTIEQHIDEIVVELIVAGEVQYRESVQRRYQYLVERKTELEEKERRRKEEEEVRERERQIKAQKERVERLLNEALALRQAADIRAYVEAVRATNALANDPLPQASIDEWTAWALTEADRIDPVHSGQFLRQFGGSGDYSDG